MDSYDAENGFTPPDTVAMKAGHQGLRVPLSEVQRNLTYLDTPEIQKRPKQAVSFEASGDGSFLAEEEDAFYAEESDRLSLIPTAPPATPLDEPARETASWQSIQDVLLWRNPALSALLFLVGSFLMLAGDFVLRGDHSLTLLSGTCYVLLADLAINCLFNMTAPKAHANFNATNSSLVRHIATKAAEAAHKLAENHDRFLSASDPVWTFKVASALCVLSVLGSLFSIWRLACLGFVAGFTVPVAHLHYHGAIRNIKASAYSHIKNRWDALGLSRKAKAGMLGVGLLCLWVNSNWTTCSLTLLMGLLIVRCHLSAKEVAAISTTAAPMVKSAKKRVKRMSLVAADFARHSLGGIKTHHQ
ncbi:hypothetical protein WJX72_003011 [[Myrmecia] bisecta]|uniref:Reticulon-like protein n=1 Tax=[Myrmecia] bisecta TaxID=41462 RepID=A0AAW1Q8G3_9CHLO